MGRVRFPKEQIAKVANRSRAGLRRNKKKQ